MSVAVGTAHPSIEPLPRVLTSTYTSAGTAMPQRAAITGRAAALASRRSPATSSRLSSMPATKKKIASRPSAAQCWSERFRPREAGPMWKDPTL